MIFRRMVLGDGPTITRRKSPCIVLEGSPTHSPRRVVLYFYRNSVVCFQEQQVLFQKRCFLIHVLGKCEGVGEDSTHGIGHVDIQVGSRIYLSVCLHWIIVYALRWGVTHLG